MKTVKYLSTSLILLTAFLAPQSSVAQINIAIDHKPGLCAFSIPAGYVPGTDKTMKLQFSHRVSDGTTQLAILVNGWPKAQDADPNYDFPVTVVFDTDEESTSDSAGYSSGFNDMLWAQWNAGENASDLLSKLEKASFAQLKADNMNFDNINLQVKGGMYRIINSCAERKRANGE